MINIEEIKALYNETKCIGISTCGYCDDNCPAGEKNPRIAKELIHKIPAMLAALEEYDAAIRVQQERENQKQLDLDKLREMVEEAASCDYIISYKIEKFTIEELDKLTEIAKLQTVKVELHAEHSNFAQGVLIQLYKWPLPWEPDFDNMPVKLRDKETMP